MNTVTKSIENIVETAQYKKVIPGYITAQTSLGFIEIINLRGSWDIKLNFKFVKSFDLQSQAKAFVTEMLGA
jgi:hypothetical protein